MLRLTASDWVYASAGGLYTAPFMGQFLLYRLNDINCSLLVCHDAVVQTTSRSASTALSVSEAIVYKPAVARIYFAPFSTAKWADLTEVTPKEFNLQAGLVEEELENLIIQVEPHRLDSKGMHDLAAGSGHDYRIDGTAYSVSSPVALAPVGRTIPPGSTWIECWKIKIKRMEDGQEYGLHSVADWSLTAAQVGQSWRPRIELHLRKIKT